MLAMTSRSIIGLPHQRSFDDLGTPLHDVTFCIIDLETTGGDRNNDMITEIGAVKVRGGECLGTFQTLVNPGRAIPPQITVLTGLSDVLVSGAPRIEAVLATLIDFVGDSVIVGHNVGFDVGFLRAACTRAERPPLAGTIVDTVALARRLVRDEVPNCKLGTLASRFRLDHQPSHRALDDALATADLLHLLIERAAGLGVVDLDDLVVLSKLAGHPQAGKLKMTADLPRTPGVYMFRGHRDEILYVGKATNLRQRVRSYFGSDDRRKIGPMLRETQSVAHLDLPDALTAEVIESRMISRLLPRYNRAGTRADKYCYVKLDVDSAWPRLSVVKNPSAKGLHLGPLPSRTMAHLVVEAIQTAGDDGFQQYLAALRVTLLEDGFDPRFDNAIRDWAHSSSRTAEVLAKADALRIAALERMFHNLGFDEKRTPIRARNAYFHQVGYGTLEIHDDPDERLLNLRYYAEALTGRADLLICETAHEVRQFILSGLPPERTPA